MVGILGSVPIERAVLLTVCCNPTIVSRLFEAPTIEFAAETHSQISIHLDLPAVSIIIPRPQRIDTPVSIPDFAVYDLAGLVYIIILVILGCMRERLIQMSLSKVVIF